MIEITGEIIFSENKAKGLMTTLSRGDGPLRSGAPLAN